MKPPLSTSSSTLTTNKRESNLHDKSISNTQKLLPTHTYTHTLTLNQIYVSSNPRCNLQTSNKDTHTYSQKKSESRTKMQCGEMRWWMKLIEWERKKPKWQNIGWSYSVCVYCWRVRKIMWTRPTTNRPYDRTNSKKCMRINEKEICVDEQQPNVMRRAFCVFECT